MKLTTYANVHVLVEVPIGPYDETWTVGAIMEQARKEGPEKVIVALQGTGFRVLGETRVNVATTETP